ncbi:MAG: ribonuclease J [Clostridia bacterium]
MGEVLQEKGKHSTKNSAKLRVVFLGGVGEIGKNMTALEYGNDIIVVDCGVSFPTSDMPGIDLVIPDITYLKENKTKIRGLLLTHGHEDHIGAVPFVAKDLGLIDIYGSKLTLALVENKLIERNATENVKKHVVNDQDVAKLGVFSVEFLRVTHSVAGSLALSITTPVGVVFFTGDFKIDHTPTHSLPMNLPRIAEIGSHGVALLLCDSTNVEREGYTPSEKILSQKFREIFEREKSHRLFVATFSSNVDRLQEVFDLAKEFGRKVAISGRSMQNVVETAGNAGYIKYDKNILIPLNQLEKQPYDKMVILTTGSQGEPMSALTRMASGEFNKIALSKNDTIIISATPIPGNEKDVYRVINNLFRLGCNVVYSEIEDVHVSGHAYKEELKLIHSLVMPKFFIPVHGEYRHLWQHQRLAIEMGLSPKNSTIVEIGDVVELGKDKMTIKEKVVAGNVFIDGLGIGDIGSNILKDRLALAEDGIVIVVCGIENGQVSAKPQVFSRGCFYTGDNSNEGTVEEIKQLVRQELASANLVKLDVSSIKGAITKQLRGYFRKKFQRFPMLLVVVMSSELDV